MGVSCETEWADYAVTQNFDPEKTSHRKACDVDTLHQPT